MLKKFSCTVLLVPVVVIFNVAMLAVEVIMLRAGTGSLNNADKLPSYPGWYTVLVIPTQRHDSRRAVKLTIPD
jgi:hypothetical protein